MDKKSELPGKYVINGSKNEKYCKIVIKITAGLSFILVGKIRI
jgi:hypothetical protein